MSGRSQSGFSLVELVVIVILVGILAVVAIPRLVGVETYDTAGLADRVMAGVRYAQKQAIAKRRNVCVSFTTNSVSFTYASAAGASAPCDTNLAGPAGQNPYVLSSERGSAVLSATPASFGFDALGRPLGAASGVNITVTGDGTRTFRVEPETGYVHP